MLKTSVLVLDWMICAWAAVELHHLILGCHDGQTVSNIGERAINEE